MAQGVTPWLGLRGGVNYFTYNYENYTNREMITIFIPFKKALRISAGFLINRNTIDGKATFGDDELMGLCI